MVWMTILQAALKKVAAPLLLMLGEKIIGNIGASPSLKTADKAVDVEQLSNALSELRSFVSDQSKPIFQEVNQSIIDYVEDSLLTIDDKSDLLKKYQISTKLTMERLRRIQKGLDEFRESRLYRQISLDNPRCRSILMLPAGEKKQADMAKFSQSVIMEILEEQAKNLQGELEGLYSDMEKQILHSVKNLEATTREYQNLVASIDAKDENRQEELLGNAMAKVTAASIVADFTAKGSV